MKYKFTTPYGVTQQCDLAGVGLTYAVIVKTNRVDGGCDWRAVLGATSYDAALAESERLAKTDWSGRVYSEAKLHQTDF